MYSRWYHATSSQDGIVASAHFGAAIDLLIITTPAHRGALSRPAAAVGRRAVLALNAPAAVAGHEGFDLVDAHAVDVPENRVLEGRRGGREFERPLVVTRRGPQSVDQAGGEGVTA